MSKTMLALNAGSSSIKFGLFDLTGARAFSSEVDTGSREENASKQESRAPFRFYRNGKGHFAPDNAIAGRPGLRDNGNGGVTNERRGSTDAAADRICGCPGRAGRDPLGLPDSPKGQQGTGRSANVARRRDGS